MKTVMVGLLGAVVGAVLVVVIPLVISIFVTFRAHRETTDGVGMSGTQMSMIVPTILPILIAALVGCVVAVVWYRR